MALPAVPMVFAESPTVAVGLGAALAALLLWAGAPGRVARRIAWAAHPATGRVEMADRGGVDVLYSLPVPEPGRVSPPPPPPPPPRRRSRPAGASGFVRPAVPPLPSRENTAPFVDRLPPRPPSPSPLSPAVVDLGAVAAVPPPPPPPPAPPPPVPSAVPLQPVAAAVAAGRLSPGPPVDGHHPLDGNGRLGVDPSQALDLTVGADPPASAVLDVRSSDGPVLDLATPAGPPSAPSAPSPPSASPAPGAAP
ncbi:MAG: hypothetical protein IT196_08095, partial [Acidimicrobiales bacterium]|nr:hypothetical protein [Acidimicrobiales bacterium]